MDVDPRDAVAPSRAQGARIALVSPCRDEAATLERTIEAVAAQTLRPAQWVIVDDGSTDGSGEILAEAAARLPWLKVVTRSDRGFRKVGAGVIEAFDAGRAAIDVPYNFIVKLDVDLEFGPGYLERALGYFASDPRLAALSGRVFCRENGRMVEEFSMIEEAVTGCFKLYRREAFEAIGGFVREVMWDGIDIHQCRRRGMLTTNLPDPELRIIHLRRMGASDGNVYRGRLRWGEGQWFMGTSFLYVLASGAFRTREKPYVIGGLLIIAGFLRSALRRRPRFEDLEFRRSLRAWQRGRLRGILRKGRGRRPDVG